RRTSTRPTPGRRRRAAWAPTATATMSIPATRSAARSRASTSTQRIRTLIPLPNPEADQPYQVAVDDAHNVWTNLWSTDKIAKFNPATNQWTLFDLPTRGTESRYISVLERPGQPLQVVVPYSRGRKVGVLTPRSDADLVALRVQVTR